MRPRVLWAVMRMTFREHVRTPEALFWTYVFPVMMAVVLGLAFGAGEPPPVEVAVLEGDAAGSLVAALEDRPRLEVRVLDGDGAERELTRGNLDVVVRGTPVEPVLRLDPARENAEVARLLVEQALQEHAGRRDPLVPVVESESRPGARYIDFLVPGLIGLNLLGSGLWGIGFHIVYMRTRKLLRRLMVAPMGRGEFLAGFLLSRLVLMVPESLAIVVLGWWVFGVPVRGSLAAMALLTLAGGMAFAGIGLLVASRARTTEAVSGLMNLVLLPMWLLGGSFFSNDRFPEAMKWLVDALPLSMINDGMREVMLGGAGLAAVWPWLGGLAVWAVVPFAVAVRVFRWR